MQVNFCHAFVLISRSINGGERGLATRGNMGHSLSTIPSENESATDSTDAGISPEYKPIVMNDRISREGGVQRALDEVISLSD